MARLTGLLFGQPAGKAGDIIFRRRNGKSHFYLAPEKSTKPLSIKVKQNVNKFSYCSKFASAVLKIRAFSSGWENNIKDELPLINRVISYNIKKVQHTHEMRDLLLVPGDEKFESEIISAEFTSERLTIKSSPYPYYMSSEKRISLQGILQLTNPDDENSSHYKFIPFHSKEIDLLPGIPPEFVIKFDSYDTAFINSYNKYSILLNLAIKDTQSKVEKYSGEIFMSDLFRSDKQTN
jgi:hypothetical protein